MPVLGVFLGNVGEGGAEIDCGIGDREVDSAYRYVVGRLGGCTHAPRFHGSNTGQVYSTSRTGA